MDEGDGRPADRQPIDDKYGVLNQFNGATYLFSPNLGISGGESGRRLMGRIANADALVAQYVRPKVFQLASTILREQRVVVLRGADGIGKYAGAVALLRSVQAKELTAQSPALRLDELARSAFKPESGHVVRDWSSQREESAAMAFQLEVLRGKLETDKAHLVITLPGSVPLPEALRKLSVEWAAPPPDAVLNVYLREHQLADDAWAKVSERFADCVRPGKIAEFAAALSAGDVPLDELLRASNPIEVVSRFDGDPSADWVALVAALAFLDGVTELAFERALKEFEAKLWKDEKPIPVKAEDESEASVRTLPQSRGKRAARPLVMLLPDSADRRLTFEEPAFREQVLAELWQRYDRELWDPLMDWVESIAERNDPETQLNLALGVALLAGAGGFSIVSALLDRWADQDYETMVTAAYVIWWLSMRDTSAAFALSRTVEWAQSASIGDRLTAVLCFSGPLGVRYPGEALRWLWHLAHADPITTGQAELAIAGLFCSSASVEEPEPFVPMFLQRKLEVAVDRGGLRRRTDVLRLIQIVLSAAPGGRPAAAELLFKRPGAAEHLAGLWAASLSNRPTRGAALGSLVETLLDLHRSSSVTAIATLGKAIRAAMSEIEVEILERDLMFQIDRRDSESPESARLIVTILFEAAPDKVRVG